MPHIDSIYIDEYDQTCFGDLLIAFCFRILSLNPTQCRSRYTEVKKDGVTALSGVLRAFCSAPGGISEARVALLVEKKALATVCVLCVARLLPNLKLINTTISSHF